MKKSPSLILIQNDHNLDNSLNLEARVKLGNLRVMNFSLYFFSITLRRLIGSKNSVDAMTA